MLAVCLKGVHVTRYLTAYGVTCYPHFNVIPLKSKNVRLSKDMPYVILIRNTTYARSNHTYNF